MSIIEENLKQIELWCSNPSALESLAAIREQWSEMERQLAAIDAPGLAAVIRESAAKDEQIVTLEAAAKERDARVSELGEALLGVLPLLLEMAQACDDYHKQPGRANGFRVHARRAHDGVREALSPGLPAKESAC